MTLTVQLLCIVVGKLEWRCDAGGWWGFVGHHTFTTNLGSVSPGLG